MLYFLFMFILSLYLEFFFGNFYCLMVLFIVNLFLTAYETFQMIVFSSYFSNVWNYLDWIRCILIILYCFMRVFLDVQDTDLSSFLGVLTLLSWVRGISYFRIFKMTRYLVRLLKDSTKGIMGFLVFFSYIVLASSLLNQIKNDQTSFTLASVFITYNLVLGGMEDGQYGYIQILYTTASVILLCIIITNLLISVIGDCFEKVQNDSLSADTQELLEMIYEVENMIVTRRESNFKLYFHSLF